MPNIYYNPRFSRRAVLGLSVAAATAGLAACGEAGGGAGGEFGSNETLKLPDTIGLQLPPGAISSGVEGVPNGYLELPNPLPKAIAEPPGGGKPLTTFQINWTSPPRPRAQNVYWQEFEKRLNLQYQPTLVAADQYDTKLSTMLASGQIPDMVHLDTGSANAQQAIRDGAFAELSSVLAGDKIASFPHLAATTQAEWKASSINNGLYGVPCTFAYGPTMFAYRYDWAKTLGYPDAPKNADEFAEVITAMTKGRPEKDRATFGIGGFPGSAGVFIDTMFRVPNGWAEVDGKFINRFESDEFEQSLNYSRKLWAAGAFHPDGIALGKQGAKDRELFYSGEVGFSAAGADHWFLSRNFRSVAQKDPGAEPKMLLPFGHDGKVDPGFPLTNGIYALIAISAKTAGDPARLEQMLHIFNYLRSPIFTEEGFFLRNGVEGVHYTYDSNRKMSPTTDNAMFTDKEAMNYTGLVPPEYFYPENPEDVKTVIDYTSTVTKTGIQNPASGLFAPSDAKLRPKLGSIIEDYTLGMVTARRPLTDLEKFRSEWRAQGGDTLRNELTEAQQKRGG